MPTKNKPIHEIPLGLIRAAIWKHEHQGVVHYDTTFSRLYQEGDTWKRTESFKRDDLLPLAKVADLAHSWIHAQPREATKP
jgi:hypothetical protein